MADESHELIQVLTFNLGDSLFAIDIATVREIIQSSVMTKVPLMPAFIRGIINLRGTVVPVIDLQSRFGWAGAEVGSKTCIVIIEAALATGPSQLGLMVDSVSEVLEIESRDIEPPPHFGAPIHHDLIEGMAKVHDAFLIILKPSRAFDMEVLTNLVAQEEMA